MAPAIKGEQDHTMGKRLINAPMEEFGVLTDDFDCYDRFLDKDQFRYAKGQGSRSKYGCAAIATCSRGKGTVFNAGATCWIHGLRDRDFFTEQITCNVLNRLSE